MSETIKTRLNREIVVTREGRGSHILLRDTNTREFIQAALTADEHRALVAALTEKPIGGGFQEGDQVALSGHYSGRVGVVERAAWPDFAPGNVPVRILVNTDTNSFHSPGHCDGYPPSALTKIPRY